MYDGFHVQAKLWSEDLRIDTFHGLLAPWQWRNRTADTFAVWWDDRSQLGEMGEVKEGGADMGIRQWGLPAIFSAFMAPIHRNSHAQTHAKNINIKCRNTLALVTINTVCQWAAWFLWVFVKWRRNFMIGFTTKFVLARHHGFFQLYHSDVSWQTVGRQRVDSNAMQSWWQ